MPWQPTLIGARDQHELFRRGAGEKTWPIDRILLAYHAFANVLLFYRDCLASGLDDDCIVVTLFPDSGERYLSKLNREWMGQRGLLDDDS